MVSGVHVNVVSEEKTVLSTGGCDSVLYGVSLNICTGVPQILSFWISLLSGSFHSSSLIRV